MSIIYSHTNIDRTPYTYLIGWSTVGLFYYGVRYGKGCHPSDLWVSYFTSSQIVKEMREQWGEPDIIQIRKIFSSVKLAQRWEERVLKRCNVIQHQDKWLNGHQCGSFSQEACKQGNLLSRTRCKEANSGIYGFNTSDYHRIQQICKDKNAGFYGLSKDQRQTFGRKGGKYRAASGELQRLSKLAGVARGKQLATKIMIDGVSYSSQTEASKQLGILQATISGRLKNPNFPNYQYL